MSYIECAGCGRVVIVQGRRRVVVETGKTDNCAVAQRMRKREPKEGRKR